MTTEMVGYGELLSKFDSLLGIAESDEMTDALLGGGLILERGVKQNIQRQKLIDTGNLRASVIAQAIAKGLVAVFTNVVYAAIHEFGGQAGRGKRITFPARPYFRPAIDEHQNAIARKVADGILQFLYKVAG